MIQMLLVRIMRFSWKRPISLATLITSLGNSAFALANLDFLYQINPMDSFDFSYFLLSVISKRLAYGVFSFSYLLCLRYQTRLV